MSDIVIAEVVVDDDEVEVVFLLRLLRYNACKEILGLPASVSTMCMILILSLMMLSIAIVLLLLMLTFFSERGVSCSLDFVREGAASEDEAGKRTSRSKKTRV